MSTTRKFGYAPIALDFFANLRSILTLFVAAMLVAASSLPARAGEDDLNFSARKAIIINNAENSLALSDFLFVNQYTDRDFHLVTRLAWKNTGQRTISAFEVVTLYFDPFNRALDAGGRWLIPGHDSADWRPLAPGDSGRDGLTAYRSEQVLTGIVYVHAIRFEDGNVWYSDEADIASRVREALPGLTEMPKLDPGPSPSPNTNR